MNLLYERSLHLLAKRVKNVRENNKLSIKQLSYLSKVSQTTLEKIEKGETNPLIGTLDKIANALNIKLYQMLKGI